jgi:putative endopeptidase
MTMSTNTLRWGTAVLSIVFFTAEPASGAEPPPRADKSDFLADNLDPSVSASDDFFEYANGGWLKSNPIPPTESGWGLDSLVRAQLYDTLRDVNERAAKTSAPEGTDDRKIGDFWGTAMDTGKARRLGASPLRDELANIEGVNNLRQALDVGFALQILEVNVFFRLVVDQDKKNSETIAVYVNQGGLGLPDRDFYVNADNGIAHIREEYVTHIAHMLRLLGRSETAANSAARAVMEFEISLAHASRTLAQLRDPVANYHRMTPAELTRGYTPSIEWNDRLATWSLRPDFIVVRQPEYFTALDHLLAHTPVSVLQDYLRFHLISAYAEYLSPSFDSENFKFYKRLMKGQKEPLPRWKRVLDAENNDLYVSPFTYASPIGMLVGRRYVREQFTESAKTRYTSLVEGIKAAYRERIKRLDWMSEVTKAKALEKLALLDRKVGYPDEWPDLSALTIGRGSYCANMMNVARWRFQHMVSRFGKPVDRREWRMTPQTYNAYYSPSNNEIVLPAANFIVPGIVVSEIDDAVAYGYFGATIGHEITHGFDDQGRKYDAHGNLVDWWTADDAAKFETRAAVLVKQFDAYEPLAGFHINGKASLGENIADYGGLLIALAAFKETEEYRQGEKIAGRTPIQRFFLAYAYSWMGQEREEQIRNELLSDFHPPVKWRVLGPLSNVPDFYAAFDVQPGRAMWRSVGDRANIW